jgi:hypothetical protein
MMHMPREMIESHKSDKRYVRRLRRSEASLD